MLTDFIGGLTENPGPMNPDLVRTVLRPARLPRSSTHLICTAAVVLSSFALSACNPFELDGVSCPAIIVPSLVITVLDSATGSALAVKPTLDVRSKAGDKVMVEPSVFDYKPTGTEYSVYGGAGTFNVSVGADGYRDFTKNGIPVVISGKCKFPQTVEVSANLVRTS